MKSIDPISKVRPVTRGASRVMKRTDAEHPKAQDTSDAIDYEEVTLRDRVTEKINSHNDSSSELSATLVEGNLDQLSRSLLGGGE